MIVMKFGGTSIEDIPSIERIVGIIKSRLEQQPVVINSAMGKTTRKLLDIARLSADGMDEKALLRLNEIREYHFDMARGLMPDFEKSETRTTLERYFEELQRLLGGLSVLRELTPRSQDRILSYGELVATTIIASTLQNRGINARWLDAREFIITDERFTRARPIDELTFRGIQEKVLPLVESGHVPVTQGFIGSTRSGDTTTLGFEGSDFTAALAGAALDVSKIEIWKDVNGIMTADPCIFAGARTAKNVSFEEASELTFFGAKVLHPCTIEPACRKDIPVNIYNSRQPDAGGTTITAHANKETNIVKSIAYGMPVCIMNIVSDSQVDPAAFLRSVFDILEREGIIPCVVTTAGVGIAMAVSASEDMEHAIDELTRFGTVNIAREKATISLVGENIRTTRDFAPVVFQNLEDVNVYMVSQGASPISLTFVVDESDVSSVIARLHEAFFREPDPDMFD
ncbi:MAG: aspartate kinase [Deltaproteobacteria bacterium]|nr:aspartate kinase [Deltaproteobacteria bacterium]MBN2845656.1 aspartate kinase [Deltaproteobacteria bacterium]